jgi:plastocyanin
MRFRAARQAKPRSVFKLSTLTLALGLLALVGCGSSSSSTNSAASTPASAVVTTTTLSTATASAPSPSPSVSTPASQPATSTTSSTATTSTPASTHSASKPRARPVTSTSSIATSPTPAPASTPSARHALSLQANPEGQLKYNKTSLTAKAGKVSIAFTNMAPLSHNMTIESSSGKILGATPTFHGATKTVTLSLKPGAYKFFCSVPGHRMAGMEGTLTVK